MDKSICQKIMSFYSKYIQQDSYILITSMRNSQFSKIFLLIIILDNYQIIIKQN